MEIVYKSREDFRVRNRLDMSRSLLFAQLTERPAPPRYQGGSNSGQGRPNTNDGGRYEGERAFRGRGDHRRGTNTRTSRKPREVPDMIALISSRTQVDTATVVDETTAGTELLIMDHR
jgi:hypothetical protein